MNRYFVMLGNEGGWTADAVCSDEKMAQSIRDNVRREGKFACQIFTAPADWGASKAESCVNRSELFRNAELVNDHATHYLRDDIRKITHFNIAVIVFVAVQILIDAVLIFCVTKGTL